MRRLGHWSASRNTIFADQVRRMIARHVSLALKRASYRVDKKSRPGHPTKGSRRFESQRARAPCVGVALLAWPIAPLCVCFEPEPSRS